MKKFLIIGNGNAVTYKDVFPLIKDNKAWLGVNNRLNFITDDNGIKHIHTYWFTSLEHNKRNTPIALTKHYTPDEYPKYDNYDAINVDKVKDIPCDYDGIMGVPITFFEKYCPTQFEIINYWNDGMAGRNISASRCKIISSERSIMYYGPVINKQAKYSRILIKRK